MYYYLTCGCCLLFQDRCNPPCPLVCAFMMSISISINVPSINVLSINVGINTQYSTNMAENQKGNVTFGLSFMHRWHMS